MNLKFASFVCATLVRMSLWIVDFACFSTDTERKFGIHDFLARKGSKSEFEV